MHYSSSPLFFHLPVYLEKSVLFSDNDKAHSRYFLSFVMYSVMYFFTLMWFVLLSKPFYIVSDSVVVKTWTRAACQFGLRQHSLDQKHNNLLFIEKFGLNFYQLCTTITFVFNVEYAYSVCTLAARQCIRRIMLTLLDF